MNFWRLVVSIDTVCSRTCYFVNVKQRFIRQFQTRKIHHFPVQEHYKTCNQCLLETKIGQNQAIQPSFWIHDTEHSGVAIEIWFGIHLIECRLQSLSDIETKMLTEESTVAGYQLWSVSKSQLCGISFLSCYWVASAKSGEGKIE